ncbi:MAG: PAS domain-containing protein [Desulfobacteraceae bacterium]|jgi:PAS domain S-box-containing protein
MDKYLKKTSFSENQTLINRMHEWQQVLDNINDAVWVLNHDHRISYTNKTAEKLFKLSASEMIGKRYWEIFFREGEQLDGCPFQIAAQKHIRGESETRIGEEWFQITVDPVLNTELSYTGAIFIARNITLKKQAEKTSQDAEYKYRLLFDKMLNIFALHEIICDETGTPVDYRYLELNPAFEGITGFKVKDFLGKTAIEVWPGVDPLLIEIYGKVALTGEPLSFEFFNEHTDQYFLITVYQPEELKFACVLQDITEQKHTEKELKENEHKLKKAHDELEQCVFERTGDLEKAYENLKKKTKKLEKANTAISVLLEKREADNEESEEKILLNVKELLIPYVEKLKSFRLTENQKKIIELLEAGLNDIISPFVKKLTSRYMGITSRELQVADMVKEGKTSKEIAEILYIAERTVAAHRINLRKKLGLRKRANLRTYLLSLNS